ncbi:hypothetical protein [Bradyrhizobium uaiense]|nr:hypothetical protein [Bradyrhizobium uaiense]
MRLIRLILIDLTLMLLAPGSAEATIWGAGVAFTSATKTMASWEGISAAEPILSSGASRQPSRQTSQAAPIQLATNTLGHPAKPAEHSTMLELGSPCVIGKRAGQRPIASIIDGSEILNKPLIVTPSICNAAATRYGPLGEETPRWNATDWTLGGMVIAAMLLVILVERYITGAGT